MSSPSGNAERLLNLGALQKAIIHEMINEVIGTLVNLDFLNEENEDQLRIRQHTFLKGSLRKLVELLEYDDTYRATANERLSDAVTDATSPKFESF